MKIFYKLDTGTKKQLFILATSLYFTFQFYPSLADVQTNPNSAISVNTQSTTTSNINPNSSAQNTATPISSDNPEKVTGILFSDGSNNFPPEELQVIIENKYYKFSEDPNFIKRIKAINNNSVDFPNREFILKAFEDEQKNFIAQRHKDLVLFLENYLVKHNLPNMTDVSEFVDKIENKYFYFEQKTYGSSVSNDKNYYRTLLGTTISENEPAFNQFVRDYIRDSEIKRKKFFSNKVNNYFYELHLKEGVHYDKTLQDSITNNLIELFTTDSIYTAKYCNLSYEKFFTDKSLVSTTYANAVNTAIEAFKKRILKNVIPAFIKLQAGGIQLITTDNYEKASDKLVENMGTPAFVFANRDGSDTDILYRGLANLALKQENSDSKISAKVYLQTLFDTSNKQIVDSSVNAVNQSLTQTNWDRTISAFLKASQNDTTLRAKLNKTITQQYLNINKSNNLPVLVDIHAQLEGADGEKTVSLLRENIRTLLNSWDVEAFQESLQNDLLREVFFPGKEQFLGNTSEAKARFQLLSFLAMYDIYYSGSKSANARLEKLLSTPLQQHRQLVFDTPPNRKLAVKEFRKMARSNEGSIIAKASLHELVVATALAASIYTNPSSSVSTTTNILKTLVGYIPSASGVSITINDNWKTIMTQITNLCFKKSAPSPLRSTITPTPSPTNATNSSNITNQ